MCRPAMTVRIRDLIRSNRLFAAILGLALLLRVLAWIAFYPALFYSDSWSYADLAVHGGISPTRQMAYPWLLRGIWTVVSSLSLVTALQHLAGVAVGVLLYLMLRRLGAGRTLAALGAAIFLLDSFELSLEQYILSEPFFTLALTGSIALLVVARRTPVVLAASGLLLAAAICTRSSGLFVLPVWLVYVLATTRGARAAMAAGLVALALPLAAYVVVYHAKTGVYGFTQTPGWFMYARVGEVANCSKFDVPKGLEKLCLANGQRQPGAAWYIWNPSSPAWRLYGRNPGGAPARLERFDNRLRRFAGAVIAGRPGAYAELVGLDFWRFFEPGMMTRGDQDDLTVSFGRFERRQRFMAPPPTRAVRTFPSYHAPQRAPAGLLRVYARFGHVPRLGLLWLLLTALVVLIAGLFRPALRMPRRAEIALLGASAFCFLLGHALTSDFAVRYLVPAVPLIVAAGLPSAVWLFARARVARGDRPGFAWPARAGVGRAIRESPGG